MTHRSENQGEFIPFLLCAMLWFVFIASTTVFFFSILQCHVCMCVLILLYTSPGWNPLCTLGLRESKKASERHAGRHWILTTLAVRDTLMQSPSQWNNNAHSSRQAGRYPLHRALEVHGIVLQLQEPACPSACLALLSLPCLAVCSMQATLGFILACSFMNPTIHMCILYIWHGSNTFTQR